MAIFAVFLFAVIGTIFLSVQVMSLFVFLNVKLKVFLFKDVSNFLYIFPFPQCGYFSLSRRYTEKVCTLLQSPVI